MGAVATPRTVLDFPAMADHGPNSKSSRLTRRLSGPQLTRVVVGAVALIFAIIFIAINQNRVRIHFVFFTVTTRVWVGFLVCLAVGALLGQAVGAYRKRNAHPTSRGGA